MTEQIVPGFQRPIEPKDGWTAKLYEKYGFKSKPSLEEIEAKATELLSNPDTVLTGAEMVLGRRVDANIEKEPDVLPIIALPGMSGEDRFGLLLLQKDIEEMQAKATRKQG